MVVVPRVDSAYGMPTCSATEATAGSPSWCIIRVNPVGANPNGRVDRRPRMARLVSTVDTSRSTEGWNSMPANARRARSRLSSPSAAPSV
jgi:hypothetical protein